MNTNSVREQSLQFGNNGATHDGRDEQRGAISGERSKSVDSQREDAGEHNGIEQSDEKDGPYCEVSESQHGHRHQQTRDNRIEAKKLSRRYLLQQSRAHEASNHRS